MGTLSLPISWLSISKCRPTRSVEATLRRTRVVVLAIAVLGSGCGARSGIGDQPVDGTPGPAGAPATESDASPGGRSDGASAPPSGEPPMFLMTKENVLLEYDAGLSTFRVIGTVDCAEDQSWVPVAMAVSRTGVMYLVFGDGFTSRVHRVDVGSGACASADVVATSLRYIFNGLAFAAEGDTGETLYAFVVDARGLIELASVDERSFVTGDIGELYGTVTGVQVGETSNGGVLQLTWAPPGTLLMFASEPPPYPEFDMCQVDTTTAGGTLTTWSLKLTGTPYAGTAPAAAFVTGTGLYAFTVDRQSDTTFVLHRSDPRADSVEVAQTVGQVTLGATQASTTSP